MSKWLKYMRCIFFHGRWHVIAKTKEAEMLREKPLDSTGFRDSSVIF